MLDMVKDQEADISLPQEVAETGNFELDLEDLNLKLLFGSVNEKDVPLKTEGENAGPNN